MALVTDTELWIQVQESRRLLDLDAKNAQARLDGRPPGPSYGYRLRCRVCLEEVQLNLESHVSGFFAKHEACQQIAQPKL